MIVDTSGASVAGGVCVSPGATESVVPGQTEAPPAADAVDVSTIIEDTLIALLLF